MELTKNKTSDGFHAYVEEAREQLRQYYGGNRRINNPGYLVYLQRRAAGLCPSCGADAELSEFDRRDTDENSTRTVRFSCGHGDINVIVREMITVRDSLRVSMVGVEKVGAKIAQKISARIVDFKETKERSEQAAIRRLCAAAKPYLTEIEGFEQDSAIDVVARGHGQEERFQVTKLYGEDFWKPLNTEDSADLLVSNVQELVSNAVKRKMKYSSEQRRGLSLVIDAWPGIGKEFIDGLKEGLSDLMDESLYAEIWVIGDHGSSAYRIH